MYCDQVIEYFDPISIQIIYHRDSLPSFDTTWTFLIGTRILLVYSYSYATYDFITPTVRHVLFFLVPRIADDLYSAVRGPCDPILCCNYFQLISSLVDLSKVFLSVNFPTPTPFQLFDLRVVVYVYLFWTVDFSGRTQPLTSVLAMKHEKSSLPILTCTDSSHRRIFLRTALTRSKWFGLNEGIRQLTLKHGPRPMINVSMLAQQNHVNVIAQEWKFSSTNTLLWPLVIDQPIFGECVIK